MNRFPETADQSLDAPPLAGLLSATAAGDREAFRRLYDATSSKLFGVVLRIVRRRDLAEDVLQEVFLRIWDHAGEQRSDRGTPMAWMVRIARNRALDCRRADRGEVSLEELPACGNWTDPIADSAERVVSGAEASALEDCLDKLDNQQRSCILLAFRDGYTHQELAERLRTPLGSIKSWIRRGQIQLRECLQR